MTGAESTGKSSLAVALARLFDAPMVSEFARTYAERVQRPLEAADVEPIARGQQAAEDAAIAASRGGLLILDTNLLSTLVYARHFYGGVMPELDAIVRTRRPALYLLCDVDAPWVADAVRDSAAARAELHVTFVARTRDTGVPTIVLRGDWNSRQATAEKAVRQLLAVRS